MSGRNSTSAMETNEISVCAKLVSPDMKAPTEQTNNQHGDQAVNNYMVVLAINQLTTTWVVLVTKQLIIIWVVAVTKQLMTTWVVLVISQLTTAMVVLITKFIMVVTSWEVVGIKQITSIETSVATRVPDHTNVVIMVIKTVTTGSINNMGKRQQIFSISSIQQLHG